MGATVVKIERVEKHPKADRLTMNHLSNGKICISNLKEDGTPRYKEGDLVVHVAVDSIVPEWLLKHQDLWDEEKGKGYMGGEAGNVVTVFKLRGEESHGMLVAGDTHHNVFSNNGEYKSFLHVFRNDGSGLFVQGDDASNYLNIQN